MHRDQAMILEVLSHTSVGRALQLVPFRSDEEHELVDEQDRLAQFRDAFWFRSQPMLHKGR